MRFSYPQTILCFSLFIQVTFAYQKNDYLKNNQRTNTKKYFPTRITTSTIKTVGYKYNSLDSDVKLRHSSSKFPHFDKLKSKIAGLDSDSDTNSLQTRTTSDLHTNKNRNSDSSRFFGSDSRWFSSDPSPKLRHHGWSNRARTTTTTTTTTASPDDDLFDTYGDMEEDYDDDEKMEDDDSSYEDFFDTLDDDGEITEDNSFQAEEPTERPTPEPRKLSPLTEYKWAHLGTPEKVQESRRNYLSMHKSQEVNNATAVLEHYLRIRNQYQCQKPIQKVIPVHLEHPDPTITYTPACTVLHRCAEDTGCCRSDATCQYKKRVQVNLYFYVKNIGADQAKVKTLSFYNHTECECREKNTEGSDDNSRPEREKRVADIGNGDLNSKVNPGVNLKSGMNFRSIVPENLQIKCLCPKEFTPKVKYNGKCHCECKDDNQDCIRMKQGKEYSSLNDRLCILNNQCGRIACEYGPYLKEKGRCPRFEEI